MKNKTKYLMAILFGILAILWIALVKCVDVAAIGPAGTSVGLSGLNQAVHNLTGVHMLWYTITDWLGILAVLAVAAMALLGLVQLIKRRSLFKVDREILALGGLYLAIFVLYVFFEKVVINYRPLIMPGETVPEASFPSSHTMLACVIFESAALLVLRYVKGKAAQAVLGLVCFALSFATVLLRLLSGVHWLTDIAAGVFLSMALLQLYDAALERFRKERDGSAKEKGAR